MVLELSLSWHDELLLLSVRNLEWTSVKAGESNSLHAPRSDLGSLFQATSRLYMYDLYGRIVSVSHKASEKHAATPAKWSCAARRYMSKRASSPYENGLAVPPSWWTRVHRSQLESETHQYNGTHSKHVEAPPKTLSRMHRRQNVA